MATQPATVEVSVFLGDRLLGSRRMTRETLVIGRGAQSSLKLDDPSISDRHAIIHAQGGRLVIADDNSTSGTRVNGEPIQIRTLSATDDVEMGPFRLRFSLPPCQAPAAPAPASPAAPAPPPADAARPAPTPVPKKAAPAIAPKAAVAPASPAPPAARVESPRQGLSAAKTLEDTDTLSDDVEDDDEDEHFVEPFSLLENVVGERFKTAASPTSAPAIEIIRYKGKELHDVNAVPLGQTGYVGPDKFPLVKHHPDGSGQFFFRDGMSGSVVAGGKLAALKDLFTAQNIVDRKSQLYAVTLAAGDYAQLLRSDAGYLIRFVTSPVLPEPRVRLRVDAFGAQMLATSLALHLLLLVTLGTMVPERDLALAPEPQRPAQLSLRDLQLETPEEPIPEPEPEPEPEPPPLEPPPVVREAVPTPQAAPRRPRAAPPKEDRAVGQAQQVLSVLQNVAPAAAPGRSNLNALVTNISAVRSPEDSASQFKIAGVIGKLPDSGVRLAAGGAGGDAETRVGSRLLKDSGVAVSASAQTGTRVRARVDKPPTRAIQAEGGTLSREEIQAVVSKRMAEIQSCYERELIRDPGLMGKIVFDWVIAPSGKVSTARQVSSTVRGTAVATCIISQILSWQFPQPSGGSVRVRYPFVFRSRSF